MAIQFDLIEDFGTSPNLILTSDPNLGATSTSDIGILNAPMQEALNRTEWLKARSGLYQRHSSLRSITATGATVNMDDVGKLILVDITDNITINLAALAAMDDLCVLKIKTFGTARKTVTIKPNGSETIRFESDSRGQFYMMNNEWAVFIKMATYWLVLDCSPNIYEVGMPVDGYATGNNLIERSGSTYNRADLARLWDWVGRKLVDGQTLVTLSVWNTYVAIISGSYGESAYPYRGCFHKGDGSSTFGIPDDRGMFTRYWDHGRGLDNNRYNNYPGGYEHDWIKKHLHDTDMNPNSNDQVGLGKITTGNSAPEGTLPKYRSGPPINAGGTEIWASENIVKNTAKMPLIRI